MGRARWMASALLGVLLLPAAGARADSPAPAPSPSPRPRLDLGPYTPYARPRSRDLVRSPRFESSVDVEGKAPRDLNATMAVWWAHFDFTDPAIYGKGIIYRQPPPKGSVDIVPLIQWAAKKYKESKNK